MSRETKSISVVDKTDVSTSEDCANIVKLGINVNMSMKIKKNPMWFIDKFKLS